MPIEVGHTIEEARAWRDQTTRPLALVPTMGFLHEGHASLIRQARKECPSVAVTIFVNPAQFGPEEDFVRYPRDLKRDLELLKSLEVDFVWAPEINEVYPEGFESIIETNVLARPFEGASRPGHFRGVATIVAKLFNLFLPQKAYFGQKDIQQSLIIQKIARDLSFETQVEICPTIRAADGLALSSRNTYLTDRERKAAAILYSSLKQAYRLYAKGERNCSALKIVMKEIIGQEPLSQIDYVSIANPETLTELDWVGDDAVFLLAVFVGSTRLIDNFVLQGGCWQTGKIITPAKLAATR